jgi:hypothetical protein
MPNVPNHHPVEGALVSNGAAGLRPLVEHHTDRVTRERAICPRRLRRAQFLKADRVGPGEYAVCGSHGAVHWVNLNSDEMCGCMDHYYRGVQCAHILRARLGEDYVGTGDGMMILALQQMLKRDEDNLKEYLRASVLDEALVIEAANGLWLTKHVGAVLGVSTNSVQRMSIPRTFLETEKANSKPIARFIPSEVRAWVKARSSHREKKSA